MFLKGEMTSSSNNNYPHLVVIETELTTETGSELTWAPCQDYRYRAKAISNQEVKQKASADFRRVVSLFMSFMEHHTRNSLIVRAIYYLA